MTLTVAAPILNSCCNACATTSPASCSASRRSSASPSWPCWPRAISCSKTCPASAKRCWPRRWPAASACAFHRIQFTPDLLPSDLLGTSIYHQATGAFVFQPGPIFAQVVLADEINRATPRTQSALLEAMSEHQVSIDGQTRPLGPPFFVLGHAEPVSSSRARIRCRKASSIVS